MDADEIFAPRSASAAVSMPFCNWRIFRGGGKYSSSRVIRISSTPCLGLRTDSTSLTRSSGADAPAVTPTVPDKFFGNSSTLLIRKTCLQPSS